METDKLLTVINQIVVSKEPQEIVKWKPTVTGDEGAFTEALQQRPLVKSTIEEISGVLKLAMLKVGIKEANLPPKAEKDVLVDHILTNYGNHSPAEIKLAFDMAISGKLDIDEKDVVAYQNFSCIYISKILNAYRKWSAETFNQYTKSNVMVEIAEPEPIETLDMIKEWQDKKEIIVDLIPLFFYDFMVTTEMIFVNDQMKWDYWEKALQAIKTELNMAIPACRTTDALREFTDFEKMCHEKMYTPKMRVRISNKAKKLIVFDYFRKK